MRARKPSNPCSTGAMRNTEDWRQRTALLLGGEALERLKNAHVLIVGLGGVGSYAAEAVARAGVGKLTLVDADTIDDTNRNRQLIALTSTLGRPKTEVLAERLRDINPELELTLHTLFLNEETTPIVFAQPFDYVIDAIDSLSSKAGLIATAQQRNIPLISALGSAGKLDPSKVQVLSLNQTYQCPLARALRQRLKQMNVRLSDVRCVFSAEPSSGECETYENADDLHKKSHRGTISYLPPIFGLFAAAEAIRHLAHSE